MKSEDKAAVLVVLLFLGLGVGGPVVGYAIQAHAELEKEKACIAASGGCDCGTVREGRCHVVKTSP